VKPRTKTTKTVMVPIGFNVGSAGGTTRLSMPLGNDRRI
jgi:hypothetical protein